MVTSRSRSKKASSTKVSPGRSRPAGERPQVAIGCTMTAGEPRADFRGIERKLQQIGRASAKLARHSMKEIATAAEACRAPMKSIWHSVARASRNVAKDAVVAWNETTVPAAAAKPAAARKSRRSPA